MRSRYCRSAVVLLFTTHVFGSRPHNVRYVEALFEKVERGGAHSYRHRIPAGSALALLMQIRCQARESTKYCLARIAEAAACIRIDTIKASHR